ncbi:MAG TPA: IS5 family transposase [Thermoanaerobaculia bacterium]|jgi:transposase|nr:IS5 family transposase [Thermoanaerobaculia bacterium]
MRGDDPSQGAAFSYVTPEQRVPSDHPLRLIREMTNEVLRLLSGRFEELYSRVGRPSIAPERLLRALLLQLLYSIRSERMLMEQLDYNLLFRWFVGLSMDDPIWAPTVFSKNRDRLLEGDIAHEFFHEVVEMARRRRLLSDEHFTVDGTLLEAWASHKSFRRKDGEPPPGAGGRDFRGERRCNDTHASTTDPDARLYRRTHHGEAKLAYLGHVLMENRNGLAVGGCVTHATGYAEREAALELVQALPVSGRITLGADKAYDTEAFVAALRENRVTPHVAQNDTNKRSAIDRRTTRHSGYAMSRARRCLVERIPAWLKNVALLRKTKHRGRDRVDWVFVFALATYNLVRMRGLATA